MCQGPRTGSQPAPRLPTRLRCRMLNDGFLDIALISALGFVIFEVAGAMLGLVLSRWLAK